MTSVLDTPALTDAPVSGPVSDPADGPPGDELPPHPVTRFVDSLGRALDQLAEVPTWSMTPAEQRDVLVRLHAQRARLAELEMRVLVSADRNDVGKDAGAT